MMHQFKNVLFYADGAKGEQAALDRAYRIACHHGASLTVTGVVESVSTDDARLQSKINEIQEHIKREKNLNLDQLIARIKPVDGKKPSVQKIVVSGKDHVSVIQTVMSGKFDLLVKSVNTKSAIEKALFGNTDMRLLHFCPCPVLILKPARRKNMQQILAAVDPSAKESQGQALNNSVIEMAITVAEMEYADLHLLHVVEPKLGSGSQKIPDLKPLELSLKQDAERKMARLVESYVHVPLQEHLLKGTVEKVIAKFVTKQNIDLLVMGSVARSGIPGFFVGNTAEKILNTVDCSVLVLKPKKWKPPAR